jgi:hypothetical protein
MAGPGKPGPPARGPEEVDYHRIKVMVLELLDQGYSKSAIARQVGYKNRSQAYRMIDRIMKEDMVGAGRDRPRLLHFERLEAMYASIEPEVIKDNGTPVDEKKVLVVIKILEREAPMTGIDEPTVVQLDESAQKEEGSRAVEEKIQAVQTWMAFCAARDRLGIPYDLPPEEQIALVKAAHGSNDDQPDDRVDSVIEADIVEITAPSIETADVANADEHSTPAVLFTVAHPEPPNGKAGRFYDGRFVRWWQEPSAFFEDDDEPIEPEPDYGGGWAVGE